jgi:hypothetical protein
MAPVPQSRWFFNLLAGLLRGDRDTLSLLRSNPFGDRPPRYVRAQYYKYTFTTPEEHRATGRWWHRELVAAFTEPVTLTTPLSKTPLSK